MNPSSPIARQIEIWDEVIGKIMGVPASPSRARAPHEAGKSFSPKASPANAKQVTIRWRDQ